MPAMYVQYISWARSCVILHQRFPKRKNNKLYISLDCEANRASTAFNSGITISFIVLIGSQKSQDNSEPSQTVCLSKMSHIRSSSMTTTKPSTPSLFFVGSKALGMCMWHTTACTLQVAWWKQTITTEHRAIRGHSAYSALNFLYIILSYYQSNLKKKTRIDKTINCV